MDDFKNLVWDNAPGRLQPLLLGLYHTISPPDTEEKDPYKDISRCVAMDSPTIVDAGAYKGEMTAKFLELFESPTIHAVEPLPKHIDGLKQRFQSNQNVTIHGVALGSKRTTITMNVLQSSDSSSVLDINDIHKQYQKAKGINESLYETGSTVEVRQVRLDTLIDVVDILKLDLQGYELNALSGATDVLADCTAVLTEVSFIRHYKEQPLFCEIQQFFDEQGYQLYDLYVSHTPDGQIYHGDALYLKKRVYDNEQFILNPFR